MGHGKSVFSVNTQTEVLTGVRGRTLELLVHVCVCWCMRACVHINGSSKAHLLEIDFSSVFPLNCIRRTAIWKSTYLTNIIAKASDGVWSVRGQIDR